MNWTRRIGKLIGKFWHRLFADHDFILWVENLVGMIGDRQQAANDRWLAGRALSLTGKYRDRLPYVILLRVSSIAKDGTVTDLRTEVSTSPLLNIMKGRAQDADGGVLLRADSGFPSPMLLTAHVIGSSVTMFGGVDFSCVGSSGLLFHMTRDELVGLGLPTVRLADGSGSLVEYYRVFGWAPASSAVEDAVAAFESPELVDCAEASWEVHQHGASVLSAKRLFGEACGSAVCLESGRVSECWTEPSGIGCVVVTSTDGKRRFYKGVGTPCVDTSGGEVRAGDTLIGSMRCYPERVKNEYGLYTSVQPSQSDIPGIHVMTDAGEMFAANETSQAVSVGGVSVLPLSASPGVVSAYRQRCADLAAAGAPGASVPASVNPCKFILDTARAGSYLLMSASVSSVRKVAAALSCIRKSAVASGMVHVYLKAEGEPVVSTAPTCDASAMRAAVSVCCTAEVQDMAATARVFI